MFTVVIFIIVISILIFVHEAGHFFAARRAGMRVDEFGFGFPPRLWGFKRKGTIYSINWIPFGGFVRINGEDGDDRSEPDSFTTKGFWPRLGVILAGVLMNFILAAVLLMFGNAFGLRVGVFDDAMASRAHDLKVQVLEVSADSPAEKAGLQILDQIVGFNRVDGVRLQDVKDPKNVQDFVTAHKGEEVAVVVNRGNQETELLLTLRKDPPAGQGSMGISMALTGVVSYPWYESLWRGVDDAFSLTVATVKGYYMLIKTLITEGHLMAEVSGPIGIARLTGQAAQVGIPYLIQFMAMISVNLAVLNAVPFPALDGGRAFLLIIEKFRGVPLNRKVEGAINAVGFLALIALMVFITAKDITRFF